ncbi:hypothetical protein ABL78_6122 [Leptomonas seymouri]|uniref:Uncharacterized protein n=1 Tax=Leptomonas seymouri TaxID=5684 RepID=A0A0N1I3T5_LEPSE|nr:hypothetical protein ABL78_6122 [Leptomonas seymouri]|eukprot:KPI84814.1 hypothetical protein ABL78_6122 [Leptomonas seymouri]
MSSPWKRVDLFSLSSVTAAASTRRRAAAAPTHVAKGVRGAPAQRGDERSVDDAAPLEGAAKPNASFFLTAANGGVRDTQHRIQRLSSIPRPKVQPATRVSVCRLLSGASLTWQASLACFVELVERGKNHLRREEKSHPVKAEAAVPLEAILLLYATLRRNAKQEVAMQNGAAERDGEHNTASSIANENESDLPVDEFKQPTTRVPARSRCSTRACTPSSLASSADTLPLRFLAYAASHHTALEPLHYALAAAFQSSLPDSPPSSSPASKPRAERDEFDAGRGRLPSSSAVELSRLLSVETVLHLGLGEVLHAAASTSPTAPPSASQLRQRWAALRTLHRLQQYGVARDYLDALSDRFNRNSGPPKGSGGGAARERRNMAPGEQPASKPAQLHHVASVSGAGHQKQWLDGETATVLLESAARQKPDFTVLLQTLINAWETHHARWPTAPAVATTRGAARVGGTSADDEFPRSGSEPGGGTPVVVDQTTASTVPSSSSVTASDAAADAAVAMVRSLAHVGSLSALAEHSGEQGEAVSNGATLSTAELTRLTLDVVHFAWNAMNVVRADRSLSSLHAAGSTSKGEHAVMEHSDVARATDYEALLQLVRTATRYAPYADLCLWLERLLPLPATPTATLHTRDAAAIPDNVTLPQRAALLCLFTRAVRRAPSWSAVCTVVQHLWPRMPPAAQEGTPLDAAHVLTLKYAEGAAAGSAGCASCRSLLSAFFESPHAPTRLPHTRDALSMWCKVFCAPRGFSDKDRAVNGDRPKRLAAVTAASEAVPGVGEGQLSPEEWSQRIYGSAPHTSDSSVHRWVQWHSAVTSAATALVRQWLHPVAAHDTALDCLAACHARCAEAWAAVLVTRPSTCTRASCDANGEGLLEVSTPTLRAGAVTQLAHQHCAFSSVFLTSEEAFDWFNLVLCRTERGVARQLVLAAAMKARWGCTDGAAQLPQHSSGAAAALTASATATAAIVNDLDDTYARALSSSHSPSTAAASAMVADVTRVVQRWIGASESAPTTAASKKGESDACSLLTGPSFRREGCGCLGEVGMLIDDVVAALNFSNTPCESNASVSSSSLSSLSAVASLSAVVRRAVTAAGLRWKRPTCLPSAQDEDSTIRAKIPLLLRSVAADAAVQRPSLSAESNGPLEAVLLRDRELRLERLREWLQFLRTCPPLLLADEEYAVVWLYILMRQVEEMHTQLSERGGGALAQREADKQPELIGGAHTATGDAHSRSSMAGADEETCHERGGQAWSRQEEEATVRLAAASLSRQLWANLPSSSLLPPMLLNWLRTRGGLRTWGGAVRFLRVAAADVARPPHQPKGASAEGHEGETEEEVDSDDQHRYLLLVLPLDRVVSMAHAMRVLRTLQAVEERSQDAVRRLRRDERQLLRSQMNLRSASGGGSRVSSTEGLRRSRNSKRGSGTICPTTTPPLPHDRRAVATSDNAEAQGKAMDHHVRHCYREIERVVLREWYSRALAAVLHFLAEHPEHTYLTPVADAPEHAALTLRAWLAEGTAHNERRNATNQEAGVLLFKPLGAPNVAGADARAAPLHAWQEWLDFPQKAERGAKAATADFADAEATSLPTDLKTKAAKGEEASEDRTAIESTSSTTLAIDSQNASEVECQPSSTVSSAASLSATATPPYTLRVPLQLLGSFILQESRIGAPVSSPFAAEIARQASMAALAELSPSPFDVHLARTLSSPDSQGDIQRVRTRVSNRRRGHLLGPLSLDALLQNIHCLLPTDSDHLDEREHAEANAKHVPDARHARPVHPELLELFQQLVLIKKTETEGVLDAAAEETVEDAVYDVLAHYATASR